MLTNSEKLYLSRQIKCRINEICKANGVDKISLTMDYKQNEYEKLLRDIQSKANEINDETFLFTRVNECQSKTFIFNSTLSSSNRVPEINISSRFFFSKFPKNALNLFLKN